MELNSRVKYAAIALVLTTGLLIGCRNNSNPGPTVAQNPGPTSPTSNPTPAPCKPGERFQVHCFVIPGDTPVVASGSSIDLSAAGGFQGTNTNFTTTASNIGSLSFDGISGFPSSQQLSGWVIHISNRGKNYKEKKDALKICSDKNCAGKPPSNNTIYFKVRSNSWMAASPNILLTFHDSECDGSSNTINPGVNQQCDFFMNVTITSPGMKDMVGKCSKDGTDGVCAVGIGKAD
jgi:hypothetical protein